MHLLRSELPTVQQALTDSAAFLRARGFSVAADNIDLTNDLLTLEAVVSGEDVPISGSDYATIYAALGRVGGPINEELGYRLARRMLS